MASQMIGCMYLDHVDIMYINSNSFVTVEMMFLNKLLIFFTCNMLIKCYCRLDNLKLNMFILHSRTIVKHGTWTNGATKWC
jgi:hypothetical protein